MFKRKDSGERYVMRDLTKNEATGILYGRERGVKRWVWILVTVFLFIGGTLAFIAQTSYGMGDTGFVLMMLVVCSPMVVLLFWDGKIRERKTKGKMKDLEKTQESQVSEGSEKIRGA